MRMGGRRLARHRLHGPVAARGATGGTEGRAVRWVTRQRKQGPHRALAMTPEAQRGTGEETASGILNEAQYFKIVAVNLYGNVFGT